jgi:hypothetical protein
MKYIIAVIILTAVIFGVSYTPKTKQAAKSQVNISANLIESQTTTPTTMPKVTIQTTKGDIEIELFSKKLGFFARPLGPGTLKNEISYSKPHQILKHSLRRCHDRKLAAKSGRLK